VKYEQFFHLSLDIAESDTVEKAIKKHTVPERLNDSKCLNCNNSSSRTKSSEIYRAPSCLCIKLKRFSWTTTSDYVAATKTKKHVTIPIDLSLPQSDNSKPCYTLSCIVNHQGELANSGHYTTLLKQPNTSE